MLARKLHGCLLNLAVVVLVFGLPTVLVAQKAPAVGYAFPAGGRAGTTVDVQLGGYDWSPDVQFLLYETSAKLEILSRPGEVLMHLPPYWFGIKSMGNDPPLPRVVSARFHLPENLPAGPLRWCVTNASGGSSSGIFVVSHDAEIAEDEHRKESQFVNELPVVVNGRLLRIEEVDRYRVQLTRSSIVTCDLMARRLGSDFHGVLEVFDDQGRKIVDKFDTEGRDPVISFFAHENQTYTVSVRDLDYRGFRSSIYRLSMTAGPRVLATIPAAGQRGSSRSVEFIGLGLTTGQLTLESTVRDIKFPHVPSQKILPYTLQTAHGSAGAVSLAITDVEELIEPADQPAEPLLLTIPAALSGRLGKRHEKDSYRIQGRQGDQLVLTAEAQGSDSNLDLALTLTGPDGKEVGQNDDAPGTKNAKLAATLPIDGEYRLVISDNSGSDTPERSFYRTTIERATSTFQLRTSAVVNLSVAAGTGALEGTIVREGGFKEPVKLTVTGLPTGITAPAEVVVEPNAPAFKIPLKVDPQAPIGTAFVRIQGTAELAGQPLTQSALVPVTGSLVQSTGEPGLTADILFTTTLKPPFKVKPAEADGGRRVHRGATHLAELLIDRDPGFTGEILLDMSATQSRHRQGIHGPALTIAPDLRSFTYPVFVPECLETARTSRLGLIAMTKLKDASGTERYVQAAVEGLITMSIEGALLKLSWVADELSVPIGSSFVVPVKVARSPALHGDVSLELHVVDEFIGLIEAKTLTMNEQQSHVDWTIAVGTDPRLVGTRVLTARATAMRDGYPVVSECELEVEFVPATAAQGPTP